MLKKLPIGVSSLQGMIDEGYLYVDKTREIHKLFAQGGKYYFLSRPRRFGKSLLISTLKEIFSGNRELFKGLWIEDQIEWKKYPVIHIDFTRIAYQTPELLQKELSVMLHQRANEADIQLSKDRTPVGQFEELISNLAKENQVVILIDEYDKPILDYLHLPEQAIANREILKAFYTVIKALDEHIRFAFLTGVSKFSKVSVFSGLNNLRDITLSEEYSTLLGYTQDELELYFAGWIKAALKKLNMSKKELLGQIRDWYNGYSWNGKDSVYNPFSILNFFQESQFQNFWFSTGTPGFLIQAIKDQKEDIQGIESYEADALVFDSFEIGHLHPISLLFQSGYLTIKEIRHQYGMVSYLLSYPNREVKDSFLKYITGDLTNLAAEKAGTMQRKADILSD